MSDEAVAMPSQAPVKIRSDIWNPRSPVSPEGLQGYSLTAVRVIVGLAFAYHGIDKFRDWIGWGFSFADYFGVAGVTLLGIVGTVQIIAGMTLLLGLWTRWSTYLLGGIMFVAVAWAHKFVWPNAERALLYLLLLGLLSVYGAGKLSMDELCPWFRRTQQQPARDSLEK